MKTRIDRGTWIALGVAATALAVYVVFVLLPQQRQIAALQDDLRTKRDHVARLGNLGAILKATRAELEKTEAYNAAWTKQAPNAREFAKLFGEISALSSAAGTNTTRFDPEPIIPGNRVAKIPLKMGVHGTFEQVCQFLAGLEGLPETIWVEQLGLEEMPQEAGYIQAEISMEIFADNPDNSGQVDQSG